QITDLNIMFCFFLRSEATINKQILQTEVILQSTMMLCIDTYNSANRFTCPKNGGFHPDSSFWINTAHFFKMQKSLFINTIDNQRNFITVTGQQYFKRGFRI